MSLPIEIHQFVFLALLCPVFWLGRSAIAPLLTGMFNVCFLPHMVFHMMLRFLTSPEQTYRSEVIWGSIFSVLCLALLRVPVGVIIDMTL